MVVSFDFGGKSNMLQMGKMYIFLGALSVSVFLFLFLRGTASYVGCLSFFVRGEPQKLWRCCWFPVKHFMYFMGGSKKRKQLEAWS